MVMGERVNIETQNADFTKTPPRSPEDEGIWPRSMKQNGRVETGVMFTADFSTMLNNIMITTKSLFI